MKFFIISGMSGSGKSRAMATLEDLGYYCVDNMPVALIPAFADLCQAATGGQYERVALAVDVRAGKDISHLMSALDRIGEIGCEYKLIYLDTATPTLINRYKATRRKHPLMEGGITMVDAIEQERVLLTGVRQHADYVVDTTRFEVAQLRETIISLAAFRQMRIWYLMSVFCQIHIMKSVCGKRPVRIRRCATTCFVTVRRTGIWTACMPCWIS